jgi:hypothetical protein
MNGRSHFQGVNTIGKIKVGMKHPQKGYPMALDYFRFTSPTQRYAERALEIYGQTNELKVTFLSNDDENNCNQRLELRDTGGSLVAYTDLEKLFVSKEEGFLQVSPDRIAKGGGIETCMEKLEEQHGTKFFECLYLRVVLLGFPIVGQWEIYTKGSKSSIESIINTYDMTKQLAGRVLGMPFNLIVKKVKSNRNLGKDNRGRKKVRHYPVIALHPDLSIETQEEVKFLGSQLSGLITTNKIQKLSAGDYQQIEAPKKTKEEYTEYEEVS